MTADNAQVLLDRACEAHERGQLPQAEQLYREALAARSDCVEALLGLGMLLRNAGRLEEAREYLAKCAVLAPQPSYAWLELGLTQVALNDRESALHAFASAARSDPSLVGAHVNLGLTLAELNRPGPALTALTVALNLKPDDAQILRSYALVALDAGKPIEALEAAERAATGLDAPTAASLLGLTHLCARRYDRAEREFRRALETAPDAPELAVSLGATIEGAGRLDDAIEHYRAYLARQPGQLHARFMLALLLLGKGAFDEGWEHYAARPSAREQRKSLAPAVEAQALAGKRVLVLTEQGIGDEVFFLRYIPLLRQLAQPEAIVYDASPKFRSVAGRIEALDGVSAQGMMPWWAGPKVLLADLPMLCRGAAQQGALPPPLRIAVLPERLAQWRSALTAFGPGPYIAVNWRGGQQPDRNPGQVQWFSQLQVKRIEPKLLGEALKGWPGTVVSVQRLPEAADLEAFRDALGANVFDAARANDDIEDLLALLACVDEQVGVSTTSVHLRGAVDRSARILVQHPPEWRWMQSGDESAWYPGFTLYRQSGDLDWSSALARLRRDLGLQEQG